MSEKKESKLPEAQVVLRVAGEQKNEWVKASQAEGQKLTDWLVERANGAAVFGDSRPRRLRTDDLPSRLRWNWHIYNTVRSSAQIRHARAFADRQTRDRDTARWQAAFDYAALDWLHANPADPVWATGKWPQYADHYLGEDALQEAERLLGLQ